jgi:hypothetical protein
MDVKLQVAEVLPDLFKGTASDELALQLLAVLYQDSQPAQTCKDSARMLGLIDPPMNPALGRLLPPNQDRDCAALLLTNFTRAGALGASGMMVPLDTLAFKALHRAWQGVNFGSMQFLTRGAAAPTRGVTGQLARLMDRVREVVCLTPEEGSGPHAEEMRSLQHALVADVTEAVMEVFQGLLGDPAAFFRKGPRPEVLALVRSMLQKELGERCDPMLPPAL